MDRPRGLTRRWAWWVACAAVMLAHGLTSRWLETALAPPDAGPAFERLQATYTRVLEATAEAVVAAPAVATPPAAAPRRRTAVRPVEPAASAPDPAAAAASASAAAAEARAPIDPPPPTAAAEPTAPVASAERADMTAAPQASASAVDTPVDRTATLPTPAPGDVATGAAAPAASAAPDGRPPGPPPFAWPRSTRLSYALTGWFRGEINGRAQVEWLRADGRYQVHLDVSVGPSFAPVMTRRMSSEGLLGPLGLMPQTYEQVTRQIVGRDRRATLRFDEWGVQLDRGERVAASPDTQDTASQFIQMVYLFTTQPALRVAGSRIEFGLALPNRVDRWIYEVGPSERIATPVGSFETFHVVPRRAAAKGDLSAEIWYAPQLQMLPVRIRITQDADTWIDLLLDRAPEVAS